MPNSMTAGRPRSDLFRPARLGPYRLANRIVMAPLTRSRAGADGAPRPLMTEYYAQRASAGLIIAEEPTSRPSEEAMPSPRGSTPQRRSRRGSP